MLEQEIAALKTENARLNQIITVLLEQNRIYKNAIANAKTEVSILLKENAYTETIDSILPKENAHTEIGNGNLLKENAHIESWDGISLKKNAYSEIGNGISLKQNHDSQISKGNTLTKNQLPVFIPLSGANVNAVHSILKSEGFNKVRYDAIQNAAKLLIHFHSRGGGGYPELRKITGLSTDGLAKYIRSLKKRGLIMRNGWQKFTPTAYGTSVLQKAGVKGE